MPYPVSINSPRFLTVYNNQLYVPTSAGIKIVDVNTGNLVDTILPTYDVVGLAIANETIYLVTTDGTLYFYSLSGGEPQGVWFVDTPQAVVYYNNVIYIASRDRVNNNGTIGRIIGIEPVYGSNVANIDIDTPVGLYIDSNDDTLYVTSYASKKVGSYNLDGSPINSSIATFPGDPYGVSYNNGYVYVADYTSNTIVKCDTTTSVVTTLNETPNSNPSGLILYNNYVYTSNYGLNNVDRYIYNIPPIIICFKENAKILTNNGYKPIQHLRKGDLVKTLKHDYVAIHMIGRKEIYHPKSNDRKKDQLYKCSQSEYPEIFEDLIITGCHSILVDKFSSEKQREKVIEVNGDTYVTDKKYRLPACADERASVYEIEGKHTIYHLALENNDYYMNYGIYANGLLVETCSKRYLKELSDMTLIE